VQNIYTSKGLCHKLLYPNIVQLTTYLHFKGMW